MTTPSDLSRDHRASDATAFDAETPVDSGATGRYPVRDFRWLMIVLLLLWLHATMDRQLLSIYLGEIGREFALSDSQLGLLSGFAFFVGYAIGVVPAGYAADRIQPRYVVIAGALIWVGSTFSGFLVTTYGQLFAARIGVGIGEAVLTPVGLALITEMAAPADRPKATSAIALGRSLGVAASLALPSALLALFGWSQMAGAARLGLEWRNGFLATAFLGLLILPVAFAIPSVKRLPSTIEGAGQKELTRFLISELPFAIPFLTCISVFNMVQTGVQTWLPLFFERTYAWNTAKVSATFGAIQLVAGILGTFATALAATRIARRTGRDAALPMLSWITIAVIPVAFLTFVPFGVRSSLVGVALLYAYAQAGLVLNPLIVMAAVPLRFRARTLAIYGLINAVSQYALGPLVYGLVADISGVDAKSFWLPCLAITVTLLIVSAAFGFALVKPHRLRSGRP